MAKDVDVECLHPCHRALGIRKNKKLDRFDFGLWLIPNADAHSNVRIRGATLPAQGRSKRSRFITLVQAATKSSTNFCFESAHA